MVRPVAQPRMAASDLAAPCLASDPCLIHQVGSSVTWPQRQKYARLASTTHVRGAPRGGKETLKCTDTTRPRSLGMIVSPDSGTREGRAHDLIVPAAWVRVRLAWQVRGQLMIPGGRSLALSWPAMPASASTTCIFVFLFLSKPRQTHQTRAQPRRRLGHHPRTSLFCGLDACIG